MAPDVGPIATALTSGFGPSLPDDDSVVIAVAELSVPTRPRVRALRYVQHPSFRGDLPPARVWQLDARRPLRPRVAG